MVQKKDVNTIYAVAVKSGPSVFNADSKKRQEQNLRLPANLPNRRKQDMRLILGMLTGRKKSQVEANLRFTNNWQGKSFGLN